MRRLAKGSIIALSILAALVALMAGCGGEEKAREYTDSSKPIEVTLGDEFVISLEGNPTSGYRWRLAKGGIDRNFVEWVGKEYETGSKRGQVGSGGDRELIIFKAVGKGKTELTLEYKLTTIETKGSEGARALGGGAGMGEGEETEGALADEVERTEIFTVIVD